MNNRITLGPASTASVTEAPWREKTFEIQRRRLAVEQKRHDGQVKEIL